MLRITAIQPKLIQFLKAFLILVKLFYVPEISISIEKKIRTF